MMPRKAALSEEDDFASVTEALQKRQRPARTKLSIGFVLFMSCLAVLFAGLGYWQLQRLEQKEAMIAAVEDRASLEPVVLPPDEEWVGFDEEIFNFRHVQLNGQYIPGKTVLVFTSLNNARGARSGPGYWVVTPMALDAGGVVMVNRGYVPESLKDEYQRDGVAGRAPTGPQSLIGVARESEQTNAFTPGPDLNEHIDYVRNIDRLASEMALEDETVLPMYVDLVAEGQPDLPQAGETKMEFPNRHMEYALTWFSLAAVTIVMTLIWLIRRRKP